MSSSPLFLWRLARSRTGEKGALRQVAEMAALRLLEGQGPGYYQLAAFWRRDVRLRDMRLHDGARAWARRVDALNPPQSRKFSQHKLVEKAILTLANVPTARFLGYAERSGGFVQGGAPLRDAAGFRAFIESLGAVRFCFKTVEGWGGHGVGVRQIGVDGELLDPAGGAAESPEAFFDRLGIGRGNAVLFEAFIEQHEDLAVLNPSSVNTLRLWAIEGDSGEVRILSAMQRVGRANAVVDNVSSGGLSVPVDLASGRMGPLFRRGPERRRYDKHPDHGSAIEGRTVPFFEEVKRVAALALARMPEARFAGVDIAVARDGPLAVELNLQPDREHAAFIGVPVKTALRTDF